MILSSFCLSRKVSDDEMEKLFKKKKSVTKKLGSKLYNYFLSFPTIFFVSQEGSRGVAHKRLYSLV